VVFNAVGVCLVQANQAGNATFAPAPTATQAFVVANGTGAYKAPGPKLSAAFDRALASIHVKRPKNGPLPEAQSGVFVFPSADTAAFSFPGQAHALVPGSATVEVSGATITAVFSETVLDTPTTVTATLTPGATSAMVTIVVGSGNASFPEGVAATLTGTLSNAGSLVTSGDGTIDLPVIAYGASATFKMNSLGLVVTGVSVSGTVPVSYSGSLDGIISGLKPRLQGSLTVTLPANLGSGYFSAEYTPASEVLSASGSFGAGATVGVLTPDGGPGSFSVTPLDTTFTGKLAASLPSGVGMVSLELSQAKGVLSASGAIRFNGGAQGGISYSAKLVASLSVPVAGSLTAPIVKVSGKGSITLPDGVEDAVTFTLGTSGFKVTASSKPVSATVDGYAITLSDLNASLSGNFSSISSLVLTGGATVSLTFPLPSSTQPTTVTTTADVLVDGSGDIAFGLTVDASDLFPKEVVDAIGSKGLTGSVYLASLVGTSVSLPTATGPVMVVSGLSVSVEARVTKIMAAELQRAGLSVPSGSSLIFRGTFNTATSALTLAASVNIGEPGEPVDLLSDSTSASPITVALNSAFIQVTVTDDNAVVLVGMDATLTIESLSSVLAPNTPSTSSTIELKGFLGYNLLDNGVVGSLSLTAVGGSSVSTPTWTDAFGIPGLDLQSVALQFGVDLEGESVPIPTVALAATVTRLPSCPGVNYSALSGAGWAGAAATLATAEENCDDQVPLAQLIGLQPGTTTSLTLNLDPNEFALAFDITGPVPSGSSTPGLALEPLSLVAAPSVAGDFQVDQASIYVVPLGANIAGVNYPAGVSASFQGSIMGESVDVQAGVSLVPTDPSITAHVSLSSFEVSEGDYWVRAVNPSLTLSVEPTDVTDPLDFDISGSFADSLGDSFSGDLTLNTTGFQVSGSLSVPGGIGAIEGSFSASAAGVTFSATLANFDTEIDGVGLDFPGQTQLTGVVDPSGHWSFTADGTIGLGDLGTLSGTVTLDSSGASAQGEIALPDGLGQGTGSATITSSGADFSLQLDSQSVDLGGVTLILPSDASVTGTVASDGSYSFGAALVVELPGRLGSVDTSVTFTQAGVAFQAAVDLPGGFGTTQGQFQIDSGGLTLMVHLGTAFGPVTVAGDVASNGGFSLSGDASVTLPDDLPTVGNASFTLESADRPDPGLTVQLTIQSAITTVVVEGSASPVSYSLSGSAQFAPPGLASSTFDFTLDPNGLSVSSTVASGLGAVTVSGSVGASTYSLTGTALLDPAGEPGLTSVEGSFTLDPSGLSASAEISETNPVQFDATVSGTVQADSYSLTGSGSVLLPDNLGGLAGSFTLDPDGFGFTVAASSSLSSSFLNASGSIDWSGTLTGTITADQFSLTGDLSGSADGILTDVGEIQASVSDAHFDFEAAYNPKPPSGTDALSVSLSLDVAAELHVLGWDASTYDYDSDLGTIQVSGDASAALSSDQFTLSANGWSFTLPLPSFGTPPPGVPLAVSAFATAGGANVSFIPPSAGLTSITSYTVNAIDLTNPAGTTTTTVPPPSPVSSILVGGLNDGDTYVFTVAASNGEVGPASEPSNEVTPPGYPGAPTDVSVVVLPAQQAASVTFDPPAYAGSSKVASYAITATDLTQGGSTTFTEPASTDSADPVSTTLSGLTAGDSYVVAVTATNSNGTGTPSLPSPGFTMPAPPTAPIDVSAAASGPGQLTVSFGAPASDGSPLTYTVSATAAGALEGPASTQTGDSSPITVSGLAANTPYTVTVTASDVAGVSPASSPSAPVVTDTVPSVPTDSAVTSCYSTCATVTFSSPASDGGAPVTGYTATATPVDPCPDCDPAADSVSVSGTQSPLYLENLAPGTTYQVTAAATNGVGVGPAAVAGSVTTGPTAPDQPVISVTDGVASATLDLTPGWDGGSAITSYDVTVDQVANGLIPVLSEQTQSVSVPIDDLLAGQDYRATVTAVNSIGTSLESTVSFKPNGAAPSAPSVSSVTAGPLSLTVTFSAPTDVYGSPIDHYTLTATDLENGVDDQTLTETTPGSYTFTSLDDADHYVVTVTATNDYGTSEPGTSSETQPGRPSFPSAPTDVNALETEGPTTQATASAVVTFTPPNDGGEPITAYFVLAVDQTNSAGSTEAYGSGTATSVEVSGLVAGDIYYFTVTAYNNVGSGPASAPSNTVPSPPAAPTLEGLATIGPTSMEVDFAYPTSDGGGPIVRYTVTAVSSYGPTFTATGVTTPIDLTGLNNSYTYTVTVTASNDNSTSPASNPMTLMAGAVSPPSPPTELSAQAGEKGQAILHYQLPSYTGLDGITGYSVLVIDQTTGSETSATGLPVGDFQLISGLTTGDLYSFEILAQNGRGDSAYSEMSNSVVAP
jgi:hypothetical protein